MTHASIVFDDRPLNDKKFRVRIAVGVVKLPYYDDTGSLAADILKTKTLLNIAISDTKEELDSCIWAQRIIF